MNLIGNLNAPGGGGGGTGDISITGTLANSGVGTPAALSANQNNWNPAELSGNNILRVSSTTEVDITGIVQGTPTSRVIQIQNVGGDPIRFVDKSASSAAANRFLLGNDIYLYENNIIVLWYDTLSVGWRKAAHTGESLYSPAILLDSTDSPYTAKEHELSFHADCTGGQVQILLPTSAGRSGRNYEFVKTDGTGNLLRYDPDGSELVNSFGFVTLNSQFQPDLIQARTDGGGFYIIT